MPEHGDKPLSHLGFQRFEPSIGLATLVDCYWFINSTDPITSDEYLHADGGMGIILNYGGDLRLEGELNNEACIFDGVNTATKRLSLKGILNAVGIRFKPAGANLLLSLPLSELKNETISLADTTLRKTEELYDKLAEARSFQLKVSIIEDWLYGSLQEKNQISKVVSASLTLIEKYNGLLPIKAVARELDYNQRKIERLFKAQVGLAPKEYSGILRAEQARLYIKRNRDNSFAMMAHDLGYYDQAHFTHQFKKVVRLTPREYSMKFS